MRFYRIVAGLVLAAAAIPGPCLAVDKPTGNPLAMSDIETEQPIPLAYLSPDGTTAGCTRIRLHWSPSPSTSADDTASLTLDLSPDAPGAATFTAQFWNASLAGSLAWQKPWQGAHWKIFDTPVTDGTGIDAALAVGMIATSARRPYPKDTLVIGNLHPDSSLGMVTHLADRLDAAAKAGVKRVIIPKVELFETSASGDVVNIMRHADDLGLKCIPVDNIIEATEVAMNDPLPDPPTGSGPPKYSPDVATYIDGYAQREQTEAASGMLDAPKESQLNQYPPRQAAVWKQVYAEVQQGNEAYKGGQVYVAYRLLARANSRMRGMNALAGDQLASFDVKEALATSDQLAAQLHALMTPPTIDRAELQSAMLIAEMADWAYDIQALLEGSELVTKQTFSQRSDATQAERDRARETILSANEEARYLLDGASFFTGLLPHLGDVNPMPANTNAANLLSQLIPAQLATAQIFADGIRPQANDLRIAMLFDPRLAAYVNVLRDEKTQWDERQRRRLNAQPTAPPATTNSAAGVTVGPPNAGAPATNNAPETATSLVSTNNATVGFDYGNAYGPPPNEVEGTGPQEPQQKLSDVAQCLIWVNTDCEIATLDQKYLRLAGTFDPATHEWHAKDRSQLDTLLQLAETGALQGSAYAQEAQVDPSVFGMILERATYLRLHGDDSNALAGLRNYWRCALLGNMCWQLAHTHKAAAVDLSAGADDKDKNKDKTADKDKTTDNAKTDDHGKAATPPSETAASTNAAPAAPATTNTVVSPAAPPITNATPENPPTNPKPIVNATPSPAPSNTDQVTPVEPAPPPVVLPPVVPIATASDLTTNAAPAPSAADTNAPPIAHIATPADMNNSPTPAPAPTATNAAPATAEHAYPRALPVDISTNAPSAADTAAATGEATTANPPALPATAAKDDAYTGGDAGNTPPPRALPVDPSATNTPSAIQ
jgi:hypothetical protein